VRGALPCASRLTGFALVTVSEHSVVCLVPRAKLMHRRSDGDEVARPGNLARTKLVLLVAVRKDQLH